MLTQSEGSGVSLEQRVSTLECQVLGQDHRIAGLAAAIEDSQGSRWGRAELTSPSGGCEETPQAVAETATPMPAEWQPAAQTVDDSPFAEGHSWRPGAALHEAAAEPVATLVSGLSEQTEPLWEPDSFDEGESIVEALRAWTGTRERAVELPSLREVIAEDLEALDNELPPSLPLLPLEPPRQRRRLWLPQFRRHSKPDGVQDRLGRLRADLGLE